MLVNRTAFVSLLAIASLAMGCGSQDEQTTSSSRIAVNMGQAPADIDPATGFTFEDVGFAGNFYVRLTQYGTKPGPNGTQQIDAAKIEPYLADTIDVGDNGRTYTFTLRPWTFLDGTPIDARAVKYSFDRLRKMNLTGWSYYTPLQIKSIDVLAPNKIRFRLGRPNADALQFFAQPPGSIVQKSVIDAHGGVKANTPNKWMKSNVAGGGGPMVLAEYEPGVRAKVVRNRKFGGTPAATAEIAMRFPSKDSTLLLEARNGQADVTLGMSKRSAASLQEADGVRVVSHEAAGFEMLGLNNGKPPFDNAKVREAVSYAIPYEEILDEIANGFGTLVYGPIPPGMPYFNEELSQPRAFDMAKAKQILADANYAGSMDVSIVIPQDEPTQEQIVTAIQGTWNELGLNVKVEKVSSAAHAQGLIDKEYQAFTVFLAPGVLNPSYFFSYSLKCPEVNAYNYFDVCIPEADRLDDEALRTNSPDRLQNIYDRVVELWRAESPAIPIYGEQQVTVLSDRIGSYLWSHEMDMRTWATGKVE